MIEKNIKKILNYDNGGECTSNRFIEYLLSLEQTSIDCTIIFPTKGIGKRLNCTILRRLDIWNFFSKLPKSFKVKY